MIARSLLSQTESEGARIFYSYARADEFWRKEVDRLLPEFQWDVAVRTWYDGEIEPGAEWEPEVNRNLAAADIVLLFVGQAFLNSRYCREVELPVALDRHARGEARVVPIILEQTNPDWRSLEFARLQCLPRNGVPVSAWDDRRRALEDVVQGLVDLVVRQGLHHDAHLRWEVHLEGETSEFSHADRLAVTTELRRFTGDDSLRCVGVGSGSIALTIESSQDAFARVRRAFDGHELQAVAGREVCKVARLFGAGIRASSGATGLDRPVSVPGPDRMLLPSRKYVPTLMKSITMNDENPLRFESMFDTGDSRLEGDAFQSEVRKMIDYFLTVLAVQPEDLYVNLAPNENAKLLAEPLRGTRLGSAMLEFDFRLKRLAASLLHPDVDTGRRFWGEVARRCDALLRADQMPLTAFQRVWIVPGDAVVLEGVSWESIQRSVRGEPDPPEGTADDVPCALVVHQHLKAMTEREYLTTRQQSENRGQVAAICDQVFREIVLPVVETEVNEGENFAEMQQMYRSMILATWFIQKYGDHPAVASCIASGRPDQLDVQITRAEALTSEGERTAQPGSMRTRHASGTAPVSMPTAVDRIRACAEYRRIPENREYFERYLDVFENGVFYVERDELIEGTGLKRARAYFAGGIDFRRTAAMLRKHS